MTDPAADNPGGADTEGHVRRRVRPRDAASLILWRIGPAGPEVLMGRRHPRHRFMPDVMVFPGGRVDHDDHRHPSMSELQPATRRMLERRATPGRARAIAAAAVRELFEEAGLALGTRQGEGVAADLAALHYVCRAVTPGGRPIRFNARFLAAPAEAARGEIAGSGELERLGWYTPEAAHRHHVADITGKVLVEFLDWLEMSPRARSARPLIVFRGMDNRHQER